MFAPIEEIENELGPVELVPPPAGALTPAGVLDTSTVIRDAASKLADDDRAALMGMATSDGTIKAAFVMKTDSGWNAVAWFERKDGANVGGVGVMKTWKRR